MDHTTRIDTRKWFEKSQAALPLMHNAPACAVIVFYCILGHAKPGTNTWAMSYGDIERETGISRSSVKRGVHWLRGASLVHTKQNKRERTTFDLTIPLGPILNPIQEVEGFNPDPNTGFNPDPSEGSAHEDPPNTSQHKPNDRAAAFEKPRADEGASISNDLRQQLVSALKPFKAESEIDREIRSIVKQVGVSNVPRVIGWLKDETPGILSRVSYAISQTKNGLDAPKPKPTVDRRQLGYSLCPICDKDDAFGFVNVLPFTCNDCRNGYYEERRSA